MKKTVDYVIAGGVDMSLDTFESIGFAKVGALTTGIDMKVSISFMFHQNNFCFVWKYVN